MELKKKTILCCEGLFEPLSVDAEGNLLGGFGLIDASKFNTTNNKCTGDNRSCYNVTCDKTANNTCHNDTCTNNIGVFPSGGAQLGGADPTKP